MWRAIYKDLRFIKEEDGGPRPVQDGKDDLLCVIAEEDYGHSVAIDLVNGIIAIDYDHLGIQNGTIEITAKVLIWICEETNIVAEFQHLRQEFDPWFKCVKTKWVDVPLKNADGTPTLNEDGTQKVENREVDCADPGATNADSPCAQGHERVAIFQGDGETPVLIRTDYLTPLTWRPIWFIRHTMPGGIAKVIGAQVTLPESQGNRNVKKLVTIFENGRLGID